MKEIPRSGVSGVVWSKASNKWSSSIVVNKKHYHLGLNKDLNDAVKARYEGEKRLNPDLYLFKSPAERHLIKFNLI